jgi:hypothetical protein
MRKIDIINSRWVNESTDAQKLEGYDQIFTAARAAIEEIKKSSEKHKDTSTEDLIEEQLQKMKRRV